MDSSISYASKTEAHTHTQKNAQKEKEEKKNWIIAFTGNRKNQRKHK